MDTSNLPKNQLIDFNLMKKILTLCIVHQHPRILLGLKKRGFGMGRWNGFGGKIHDGETIEKAARRELTEEAGITALDLNKLGVLEFSWEGKPEILEVHIFKVNEFSGVPQESEEIDRNGLRLIRFLDPMWRMIVLVHCFWK